MNKADLTYLIRNIILLLLSLCLGGLAIGALGLANLKILAYLLFLITGFLIAFSAKNILITLISLWIRRIPKKK